jgi:hypothetical protein
MARSPHITEFNASIITLKDGSGMRYLTNIAADIAMPFTWRREEALMFRTQGVADDLLPKLRKEFPQAKLGLEMVKRRELR